MSETKTVPDTVPYRVVGYFRVGNENQRDINWQLTHMRKIMEKHPEFKWVGTYCDVCPATGDAPPTALMKLIKDATSGQFDIVITPSMARLTRNPKVFRDCLRDLHNNGVRVYFEKEQCFNDNPLISFFTGILNAYD